MPAFAKLAADWPPPPPTPALPLGAAPAAGQAMAAMEAMATSMAEAKAAGELVEHVWSQTRTHVLVSLKGAPLRRQDPHTFHIRLVDSCAVVAAPDASYCVCLHVFLPIVPSTARAFAVPSEGRLVLIMPKQVAGTWSQIERSMMFAEQSVPCNIREGRMKVVTGQATAWIQPAAWRKLTPAPTPMPRSVAGCGADASTAIEQPPPPKRRTGRHAPVVSEVLAQEASASGASAAAVAAAKAEPWSWSSSMDGMSSMVMGEFVSTQSSVARALPTMLYCIRSSVMSGCKASV